jgi:hypothetical protein
MANARTLALNWAPPLLLGITTIFSFVHGEYGTSVIVGVCAGLTAGLAFSALWRRK